MLTESQRLKSELDSIQAQLTGFPDGKLVCTRNKDHFKWYHSDGKTLTYIPKKNRLLAEQLAAKKYLTNLYEDLYTEKSAIDYYLRHHRTSPGNAEKMLTKSSAYEDLLAPFFKPQSQTLIDWMNSPYDSNTKYPEQLTHKTASGKKVRSKSESLIDLILYTNKIPFRYECALKLGDFTIYPDFTIRHPETGQFYYWEHFGLMDDPVYQKNTYSKLQIYASHGIIPSIQLITTFETKENPLSSEYVSQLVHYHFL